tara:strand:+ start:901 stop:1245 length:345 start_codon:yes stop_codon:yes gene_type:complete
MKSNIQKVYSKLPKTELAKVELTKVELGVMDDANKLMNLAKEFEREATQAQSNAQGSWKVTVFNYEKAISEYEKAFKMAKEIGADEFAGKINKQISLASKKSKIATAYEKKLNL